MRTRPSFQGDSSFEILDSLDFWVSALTPFFMSVETYTQIQFLCKKSRISLAFSQIFRNFAPTEQTAALWGGQMTAAQAEKRCAPNLRNENLGNFHQARLNKAGEHAASTHCAWGCAPFSLFRFS